MNIYFTLFVIVFIAVIGVVIRSLKEKRPLLALDKRVAIDDDEVYRKFYSASSLDKELVIELWHEIAEVMNVNPGKIVPTDAFGSDIGAFWITSESLDRLSEIAKRRAEMMGLSIDIGSIKTVDDYVRSFAKKIKS